MLIKFLIDRRYIIFLQLPSTMLNNIVSALAIAVATLSATTYAFSPSSSSSNHNKNWRDISDLSYQNDPTTMMDHMMSPVPPQAAFQPDLDNIMQTYDRAADCANNYGMCSIEELLDLSEGKIYFELLSVHVIYLCFDVYSERRYTQCFEFRNMVVILGSR